MTQFNWVETSPTERECQIGPWLLRARKQYWPSGPNLFSFHMWKNGKPAGCNGYNIPTLEQAQREAEEVYTQCQPAKE